MSLSTFYSRSNHFEISHFVDYEANVEPMDH